MTFYRLSELTEATGMAPRTIRYYIAEGLLPPPQGTGPAAVYTDGHRDRLRLITGLKERYVSLREIRRRLAKLSDAQVRAELRAQDEVTSATTDTAPDAPSAPVAAPPPVAPPVPAPRVPRPSATAGEQWERIALADGIELHVRADRRQERILLDALIRQARTLLGEP